ncbi:eukaryotic translation initiation factor 2-alpha kinase 3-like [Phlebotomus argentipes]|uniref:eukaryotic translation initiation factor 2-alpha kinase 3-like n=1 Tax=Phlebotomus argentipes TaxID=94469 RepID=UPI002892B82D|nr:eukaryotic translation initiation factor 2-alpha kinase 3-like [Phlebotomus argentipes]
MYIEEEEEDNDEELDEWETLRTVEDFDYVPTSSGGASTREAGGMQLLPSKPSTPVSLLVESLLQQLCHLLESDSVRSTRLYKSICEQLQQMNLIDDTWEMGEFEAMRSQYQRALFQLVAVARGPDLPHSLQSAWPVASASLDWSRYRRDFEELSFIAGGGFGKVFRARNRLDGIEYAVKKVLIKSTSVDKVLSHLKEVRTFAGLNHINIVPYKAAWMEPLMSGEDAMANPEDTDSMSVAPDASFGDTADDSVIFAASSNAALEWTSSLRISTNRTISLQEHQPHVNLRWAMLYIQMSLCQLTLREWLDKRNASDNFPAFFTQFLAESVQSHMPCLPAAQNPERRLTQVALDIFSQLANGLRYIHECRIVHHDIKPSNVFVGVSNCERLVVQLGDFGLACPLEDSHRDGAMGTPLYAAPEQLDGRCDPKSDIYSLGVILLELLIPFRTDMERARVMDDAKNGQLPSSLSPRFATLLSRLLGKSPGRPSAADLCVVAAELLAAREGGTAIAELERRLSEKDEEILSLRSQVKSTERFQQMQLMSKDLEIRELQLRYEEEKRTREEEIRVLKERLNSTTLKDEES